MYSLKKGFSLIEIVVVLGIMSILVGIATVNLSSLQNNTSLNLTLETLISDIKQQQLKAMVSDTEGRSTAGNYGIYFDTNRYILFSGSVYSASNTTNFIVSLDSNIVFSNVTLPNSTLIFQQISGEVLNYGSTTDTFAITNTTTNDLKTVRFNGLGTVTEIN